MFDKVKMESAQNTKTLSYRVFLVDCYFQQKVFEIFTYFIMHT